LAVPCIGNSPRGYLSQLRLKVDFSIGPLCVGSPSASQMRTSLCTGLTDLTCRLLPFLHELFTTTQLGKREGWTGGILADGVCWFSGGCNNCLTGCNTGYCCNSSRCNYSSNCLGSRGTGETSDSFDRLGTLGMLDRLSKLGGLGCTDRSGNCSGS